MKFLYEESHPPFGEIPRAYTLTWNATHHLYQVVDVRARRILAQSEPLGSGGLRELSADEFGDASEKPGGFYYSLFGQTEKARRKHAERALSEQSHTGVAPVLLSRPHSLKWVPNHITVEPIAPVITNCPSHFCDDVGLLCYGPSERAKTQYFFRDDFIQYTCCAEKNPKTLCNQPPCWFEARCPKSINDQRRELEERRRLALDELRTELARQRALRASSSDSIGDMFSLPIMRKLSTADLLRKQESRHRKFESKIIAHQIEQLEDDAPKENWFRRWMEHEYARNTTVGKMWKRLNFTEANAPFSFADRARGFELYHEDSARRLAMASQLKTDIVGREKSEEYFRVEKFEEDLYLKAQTEHRKKQITGQSQLLQDAKQELVYIALPPGRKNSYCRTRNRNSCILHCRGNNKGPTTDGLLENRAHEAQSE